MRMIQIAYALALAGALACVAGQERQDDPHGGTAPIFLYDDGWFEEQGYKAWDTRARWNAVADDLKSSVWLTFYVAPENLYHVKNYSTDKTEPIPPRPDPEYGKKHAALLAGLNECQRLNIPAVLMVRRYAKRREAAPSYETVEKLLKNYPCVRALMFAELGGSRFNEVDEEHLIGFSALAKRQGRKIIWALYLCPLGQMWNRMMSEPRWRSLLDEHRDVIVPMWKSVEPYENMLNWSDCVGLWLSGMTEEWGFQFDGWYTPNRYAFDRGSWRAKYWPQIYQGSDPSQSSRNTFGPAIMSTPPCLVKDTMILSALSGARYFATERLVAFCPHDGGGSLRSVREKTQRLIIRLGLRQQRDKVAKTIRAAALNPGHAEDLARAGYFHSTRAATNLLWAAVFGLDGRAYEADFGVKGRAYDLIPNQGRHYVVPVVPDTNNWPVSSPAPRWITPTEVADGSVPAILGKLYPQKFTTDNSNVLVFDAGDLIYITDSREFERTNLEFTLYSREHRDYTCTYLAHDATPIEALPVTEQTESGWKKKFVLFAGCSILLDARPQKAP
ncbi:MAG: hypothetical protein PHV28_07250 [Kiritimatiellae bacterium]|nr:hypothetical protein [Kiritimatiellia bacterium]